jgi:hypothetical protein
MITFSKGENNEKQNLSNLIVDSFRAHRSRDICWFSLAIEYSEGVILSMGENDAI